MTRFPSAIKGLIFAPALVSLVFVLKAFCPRGGGGSCFADQFAVPIFLPITTLYKIFNDSSVILNQEFLLVLGYWALTGFFIGFLIDLLSHKNSPPETKT